MEFLNNGHNSSTDAGTAFRAEKCPILIEGTNKREALERLGVLQRESVMYGMILMAYLCSGFPVKFGAFITK